MIVLFVPMMYMNLFSGETGLELTLRGGLTTLFTPYEHMDNYRLKESTWDIVGLHKFSEGETYGLNINYKVSKTIFITGDYSIGYDRTIQKRFLDEILPFRYAAYTSERLKVETIQIGIGSVVNIGGVRPYSSIGVTINKNNYFKKYFSRDEFVYTCEKNWEITLDTTSQTNEIIVGGTVTAGVIIPIGNGLGVDIRTSVNGNKIKLYNEVSEIHFLTSGTVGINYEF